MEALGQGLASIGNALGAIGGWIGFVYVVGIAAAPMKVTLSLVQGIVGQSAMVLQWNL